SITVDAVYDNPSAEPDRNLSAIKIERCFRYRAALPSRRFPKPWSVEPITRCLSGHRCQWPDTGILGLEKNSLAGRGRGCGTRLVRDGVVAGDDPGSDLPVEMVGYAPHLSWP